MSNSAENDALREVRALVDGNDAARAACRESDDCPCSYKDCYECGKWHNCTHTPYTELRAILDRLDTRVFPPGDTHG